MEIIRTFRIDGQPFAYPGYFLGWIHQRSLRQKTADGHRARRVCRLRYRLPPRYS